MSQKFYTDQHCLLVINHHAVRRFICFSTIINQHEFHLQSILRSSYQFFGMIRVITSVFLFLVRCRFPIQLSIINVLRKQVRKFEKLDIKCKKASLDLQFLQICKSQNFIPDFLKFKLANRQLLTSNAYNICQKKFLYQEISNRYKLVRNLNLELVHLKYSLRYGLNFIDFIHITTVFLASNNKIISKIRKVQNKKLGNLCSNNSYFESVTSHDPDKVLFNFSSYQLSEHEKSLLSKGLNFAISPKNLNYADYMLPFELLFRDIDLLDIPRTDREILPRAGLEMVRLHHIEMRVRMLIRIYRKMNNLL